MQQIRPFIGTDLVKVFTGIRRCGKSIMFRLIQEELQERGVAKERIVCVDLESAENYPLRDGKRFYEHIISLIGPPPPQQATTEKTYLFLDEIQELDKWETYINGLRPRHDVDIYVTGSNAKLLSGELATYLAGRYVQFEIHPFSFAEFSEMHRLLRGEKPVKEVFDDYIVFGGMPFLANLDLQYAPSMQYLRDVYKSVVVKDILLRNKIRDMDLLERIIS
jgi:predicted AAA+ superfamily ATPase